MTKAIITMENCVKCRSKIAANPGKYTEIDASSDEGQMLISTLGIKAGGTVVDLTEMKVLDE